MPTDTAWSNPEVIVVDGEDPQVVRIVASEEGWLYASVDDPRELRLIPAADVVSRQPCVIEPESYEDGLVMANYFGIVTLRVVGCDEVLASLGH